jgi:hypothetical protein
MSTTAYHRQHRAEHRERYRQYSRDRQKRIRQMKRDAKQKPCADCGVQYPYWVMQFDHVRGEKKCNISEANLRVGALLEEIAKCDVVCANCHALRHPPDDLEPTEEG